MKKIVSLIALLAIGSVHADITIKATNKLPIERKSQTIELKGTDLASLGAKSLESIHIKDSSGKELLTQAVDTDLDELHKPDIVIFQSDFGPSESKTFTVSAGGRVEYKPEDFKAFGRFAASGLTTSPGRTIASPIAPTARRCKPGKVRRSPAAASTSGASAHRRWSSTSGTWSTTITTTPAKGMTTTLPAPPAATAPMDCGRDPN